MNPAEHILWRNDPHLAAIETYTANGDEDRVVSYAELAQLVEKQRSLMRQKGLDASKIVGLKVRNDLGSVIDLLALMLIECPVVVVDARDPLERQHEQLGHLCNLEWVGHYAASELRPRAEYDLRDRAAVIVYTTGSTAASKPVAQGAYEFLDNALALAKLHLLGPGEAMACALPISHCNGMGLGLFAPLLSGARCMLFEGFMPLGYLKALRNFHATRATNVPSLLQSLLRVGEWPRLDLPYFISAAAPLHSRTAREVSARGYRVVQGYGLSECMNFGTSMRPFLDEDLYEEWLRAEIPAVGPALPGCEVRIEDGQVMLRGHLMLGYVDNPSANRETLTDLGLATGDKGFVNEHGWLTLTGRIKNVAKCSGFSVSLEEIDRWTLGIAGVEEVCAVARPDNMRGEAVTVYVVAPDVSPTLLYDAIAQRYSPAVIGLRVEPVDAIPRLRNGKVARPELASRARE